MSMGIVPPGPGIYAAMVAIQNEVGIEGISKSRENTHFRFKFRGIDEVMNALNPILSKHGVFVIPRCLEREVRDLGVKGVNVAIKVDYCFQHKDGAHVSATVWG